MATPDISTLTSSAQIFSANHTLPQIRAIHKALHAQIDDKASRLRTRVGSSYRELLGTADAICAMHADMATVQANLDRMGRRCGREAVTSKTAGLARFVRELEEDGGGEEAGHDEGRGSGGAHERGDNKKSYGISVQGHRKGVGAVSRARLLDACALAASGLLRGRSGLLAGLTPDRGDRLVLAVKVLVLGRLLVKSFGDKDADHGAAVGAVVEAGERSLQGLMRKLGRAIDKTIESADDQTQLDDVIKALSAYSLASSSGTREVLRYFLKVRSRAMARCLETDDDERAKSPSDVLRWLKLYTTTLLQVQALVPHKLSEALSSLKKDALLSDQSLRKIECLRLDVLDRWCGDEIRYYKPFISVDDLQASQAREMLATWAEKGCHLLLDGLATTLEGVTDLKSVVHLRTDILKLWITEGSKAKGLDPSILLGRLRSTISKHMLKLVETKVSKLRLVGSEVSATMEAWQAGVSDRYQALWDTDSLDMNLSHGASLFAQDVVARLYGRNDAVSRAITRYSSWYDIIDDVGQVVQLLRKQRWDDDVDDMEDDEAIERRQKLLSEEDPRLLHDHLEASLVAAFRALEEHVTALWTQHGQRAEKGAMAPYLIRILRDIRSRLPDLEAVQTFGLAVTPALHETMALHVMASPLDQFVDVALARTVVVGRGLWEGEPEFPGSPSPGVFKLLSNLSMSMADAGGDVWSPAAVSVLKRQVISQLGTSWSQALASCLSQEQEEAQTEELREDVEKKREETEQDKSDETTVHDSEESSQENVDPVMDTDGPHSQGLSQKKRDLFIQWLYDVCYLRSSLDGPGSSTDELGRLEQDIYRATEWDDAAFRQQMHRAAQESWKRSSLLFGLLA